MTKSRIAIFASGNGTNAEALFKYFQHHEAIDVVVLMSNNPQAYALTRAEHFGIPTKVFDRNTLKDAETILTWLEEYNVTHIVLAGFLWLIPEYLIKNFPRRIINIHPALLPKYGGKGMYGMRVHEAVRNSGDMETGITIHLIDEKYDEGEVLLQARCPIEQSDTPVDIANKVHALEHKFFPYVIEKTINDNL